MRTSTFEGIEGFASERGVTMVQVALGWLLAQEAVPAVAPGLPAGAGRGKRTRRRVESVPRGPGRPCGVCSAPSPHRCCPVQGTGVVFRTEPNDEWLGGGGHPQDPRVGAIDRGRVDDDGFIAEADIDRAPSSMVTSTRMFPSGSGATDGGGSMVSEWNPGHDQPMWGTSTASTPVTMM